MLPVWGALLSLAGGIASAQDSITAVQPDPVNPMINKFINTTPSSNICGYYMPVRCATLGIFSIRTSAISFRLSALWRLESLKYARG